MNVQGRIARSARLAAGALALLIAGCATTEPEMRAGAREGVPEVRPGLPAGYLGRENMVDSLALLPAPPAPGSKAFAFDEDIRRQARALRGTPRWELAAMDAELKPDTILDSFECSLGIGIDEATTPRLRQMLLRVAVDAGLSTYGAKNHYNRTRPFAMHDEGSCTPEEEAELSHDGSYPSGHTALSWAIALALGEAAPERSDAIFARGLAYGESRLVCNVHWQSDVIEGRTVAAAAVAKLHADPEFEEDLGIAKAEIAAARAAGSQPTRDCAAEASALAMGIPGAL